MNKKILIITGRFWPKKSPRAHRATELAKELQRRGFDVDVVSDPINDGNLDVEGKMGIRYIPFNDRALFNFRPGNKLEKIIFFG